MLYRKNIVSPLGMNDFRSKIRKCLEDFIYSKKLRYHYSRKLAEIHFPCLVLEISHSSKSNDLNVRSISSKYQRHWETARMSYALPSEQIEQDLYCSTHSELCQQILPFIIIRSNQKLIKNKLDHVFKLKIDFKHKIKLILSTNNTPDGFRTRCRLEYMKENDSPIRDSYKHSDTILSD